jgi:anionic cell wall polymer biosynthesis LytR-Cps2A-Psr (LCP) family protein
VQEYEGYRTRKRADQQKKNKRWWRWLVALVAVIVICVILGAVVKVYPFDTGWNKTYKGLTWLGREAKSAWPFKSKPKVPDSKWLPEGKKTANYLFALTKQVNDTTVLTTVVLASYDSTTRSGSLIYFPNDLLVNVPGAGMDQLNNLVNLDEGRISMTLVTVENLLGIEIDHYVLGTERDLRIVLDQMSPTWPLEVPEKVSFKDPSTGTQVTLNTGKQQVSSSVASSYLTYAPPGKEVELCKRQADFAPVLLGKSKAMFDDISKLTAKNADLFDTDASDEELSGIWQTYALLGGKLEQGILPVKEFKYESTIVHRTDQDALPAFVKKYIKSSSTKTQAKRFKVEILNGNGVPGIGQAVTSKLDMGKFKIVNSANADNFDHPDTVILVYDNNPDTVHAAEIIRYEMEVGRIEFRDKTQDIADISVIVGKDFKQK